MLKSDFVEFIKKFVNGVNVSVFDEDYSEKISDKIEMIKKIGSDGVFTKKNGGSTYSTSAKELFSSIVKQAEREIDFYSPKKNMNFVEKLKYLETIIAGDNDEIKELLSIVEFSKKELEILDIVKIEKNYYIKIDYKMKDSLKSTIPSAKWDNDKKMWFVGSRSFKKLEKWSDDAKKDFNIKELQENINSFNDSLKNKTELLGDTYSCKDELKSKFGAIFHNKKWLVDNDIYDEAQLFVKTFKDNKKNNAFVINKSMFKSYNFINLPKMIEKVISNFITKNYNTIYLVDDDFGKLLEDIENEFFWDKEYILNELQIIKKSVEDGLSFLDENDSTLTLERYKIIPSLYDFLGLKEEQEIY